MTTLEQEFRQRQLELFPESENRNASDYADDSMDVYFAMFVIAATWCLINWFRR